MRDFLHAKAKQGLHFPASCSIIENVPAGIVADVAQSVERILGKDEVTSSNLVISSTDQSEMTGLFRVFMTLQALFAGIRYLSCRF